MNKREKIAFYKKQLETARQLKEVSKQNEIVATRLESQAISALEMLGNTPERSRKGTLLSDTLKASLLGNLTKH